MLTKRLCMSVALACTSLLPVTALANVNGVVRCDWCWPDAMASQLQSQSPGLYDVANINTGEVRTFLKEQNYWWSEPVITPVATPLLNKMHVEWLSGFHAETGGVMAKSVHIGSSQIPGHTAGSAYDVLKFPNHQTSLEDAFRTWSGLDQASSPIDGAVQLGQLASTLALAILAAYNNVATANLSIVVHYPDGTTIRVTGNPAERFAGSMKIEPGSGRTAAGDSIPMTAYQDMWRFPGGVGDTGYQNFIQWITDRYGAFVYYSGNIQTGRGVVVSCMPEGQRLICEISVQ